MKGSAGAMGTVVPSVRLEEGNSLWGAGSLAQHKEDVYIGRVASHSLVAWLGPHPVDSSPVGLVGVPAQVS